MALHGLRVDLDKSYRETLDLLSEVSLITGTADLTEDNFPHYSTLSKAFDRLQMAIWRGSIGITPAATAARTSPSRLQPTNTLSQRLNQATLPVTYVELADQKECIK